MKQRTVPESLELTGELVVLRTPHAERFDAECRDMLSDPKTMQHLRYMAREPYGWTRDQARQRRERWALMQDDEKALEFQITSRTSGEYVGEGGLTLIDLDHKKAEFGIIIHHSFWRQGFSTEAHLLFLDYGFETLGLNKVYGITSTENTEMRGFYEHFGFGHECDRKEDVLVDGEFKDSSYYALFARDWESVRSRLKASVKKYLK